ncbi:MAG: hypothetical protein IJZ57_04070 [Clostridia bacterium]|nr:hypothetical protein [Clostridia bacterium]
MKAKKDFPFLTLFIAAAASIVIFLPLRVYQYFEVLEPETGFYQLKDFSVYFMYAVMLFVSVFSIVTSLVNKKSLKNIDRFSVKGGAAVYAIAALGFVADACSHALKFIEVYNSYIYNFQQTVFEHLSKEGGGIFLAQALFAIVSALYFFALAAGTAAKKDVSSSLKFIALAPSLWAAMRLLHRFKSTISFTNVSDLLLELFAVVFAMMFFYAFAQTMSKVDKGESYWKIFAYGIPAGVFGIACFVPRAVLSVIGQGDLIPDGYAPEICDFTVAVMILAVLISKVSISAPNKKA